VVPKKYKLAHGQVALKTFCIPGYAAELKGLLTPCMIFIGELYIFYFFKEDFKD
jgi:hypothetical protein